MKKTIISLLLFTGRVVSCLFPKACRLSLGSIRNYIYTGMLQSRFAQFGASVFAWRVNNLKGESFIYIGNGNTFEPDLQLTAWAVGGHQPEIRIGNHCLFRRGCHITACNRIIIGNHLLTGTNVIITDNSHGDTVVGSLRIPPLERPILSKGEVIIGDNVWLGNNVCVLPGVMIGDGAVVGANSVVTHDVPPYTVVAGIPAKVITCQ